MRRGSHVLEGARVNTAHLNSPTTLIEMPVKGYLCAHYIHGARSSLMSFGSGQGEETGRQPT